jgi:hypothetical protein
MCERITRFALTFFLILSICPIVSSANKIMASDFRSDMRKLWEDHITYTRNFIVSFAGNLPDQDAVSARLLQNQTDIGNAIKPFYGDAAGTQLTELLRAHILGAVQILKAAKAGNKQQTDTAVQQWQANGDQIAQFLSNANPKNWPASDLKSGMRQHLDLTLAEANDRLAGKYADDVKDYDKVHEHILGLADTLSSGIMKQFPDRFEGPAMKAM